jgi:hypothetical protein
MLSHATLLSWGLTRVDIDDLEKDDAIKDVTRLRDLIMSLYLRSSHSERKVNELWDKIEFLKKEAIVMLGCGFTIGFMLGLIIRLPY